MVCVLEILRAYELEECRALVRDNLRERQGVRREHIRLLRSSRGMKVKGRGKKILHSIGGRSPYIHIKNHKATARTRVLPVQESI